MSDFSDRLIVWQKQFGRHHLPWQNTQDPYAIWVSEIMLQQTQVSAVIGYYQKFMQRFPSVSDLAKVEQDEVLQYWSGLGYYSRARNLHRAAQIIINEYMGKFPENFSAIQTLPGIGRSTAAAIASFAFGQRRTILDGNVKRVLARCYAIEGWPGSPKIEKKLWELAESLLPDMDIQAYTQGLMDLGATLCTRNKPQCQQCPLQTSCQAWQQSRVNELPTPKPRKSIPEKHTVMLLMLDGNSILLEKRPASGIWGGLWSLPEIASDEDASAAALQRFGIQARAEPPLPALSHAFTHFKLHIKPQPMFVSKQSFSVQQSGTIWLDIKDAMGAAIPTPVRKLLIKLAADYHLISI